MRLKNCMFFAVILTTNTAALAQFKKADRMVGASIGSIVFNSGTSDITVSSIGSNESKIMNYNFSINTLMCWFISEHTVVGATLNINPFGNKTTYEQNGSTYQSDKSNSYNIGLGGFVRHYLNHKAALIPFGQLGLNAGLSNLKTEGFF